MKASLSDNTMTNKIQFIFLTSIFSRIREIVSGDIAIIKITYYNNKKGTVS